MSHSGHSAEKIIKIPAGGFLPLFGVSPGQKELPVSSFDIDRFPVTHRDFGQFLISHKEWAKEKVPKIYADDKYLNDWHGLNFKRELAEAPVVNVSWHAAAAYCEAKGGRLPTVLEWEYVAAASATKPNASRDSEFNAQILAWYSKPTSAHGPRRVGKGAPNYYGVHDLHGLVWEWTSDFNSVFISGDNRQDGDKSTSMVCGAGATGASSRSDYAAFMRYATRNSLRAQFNQSNVGFRCAYDSESK